jgi:hypothetical protein
MRYRQASVLILSQEAALFGQRGQIAQHPDAADVSRSLRGRLAQVGVSATAVDEQTVALEARPWTRPIRSVRT